MLHVPKTQYVSFDVFDTLIKRSVAQPKDLFGLMQRVYSKNDNIPEGFAEKRILAEKKAKEKTSESVSIEQIYNVLRDEFGDMAFSWMDLEIQTELETCQPNVACASLLQKCVESGRKVILISDMYLSSDTIGQMLKRCGISGYSKLYVSCEWGAKKGDGSLFSKVLRDLNIQARELTHIGDGKRVDFLKPISMGIRAVMVPKNEKQLCKIPSFIAADSAFTFRTLQACIANCTRGMTEFEVAGCANLGPLLLGYSRWLAEELQQDGIHDVFFLARDGWMLKQAFDMLEIEGIHSHYLYASRRSYLVPTIWMHPEFDDVISRIKQSQKFNMRIFLQKIGLNADCYLDKANEYGIELDAYYEHSLFWEAKEVREFYKSIQEDVILKSKAEYEAILPYLKNSISSKQIAVADIGYRGTIQNLLCELIQAGEIDTKIKGYYIVLDRHSDLIRNQKIQVKEYLAPSERINYHLFIQSFAMLFELQFFKNEGTLECFYLQGNNTKMKFLKPEYQLQTGERLSELKIISEYQNGALRFIRYIHNAGRSMQFLIEPDAAFYHWYSFAYHPSLYEANIWGDFCGEDSGNIYLLAKPSAWLRYLRHPGLLKKEFLFDCAWKIGFLKRFFKLPLPYEKLYFFLKRKYNKNRCEDNI